MNMIPLALAVLVGTLCLQLSSDLPSPLVCGWLVALAMFLAWWPRTRLFAACLAGYVWAAGYADQRLAADLPVGLEGQDLTLQGAVVSLPEIDGRATRFVFAAQSLRAESQWQAFRHTIRLSWYDAPVLQAGQGWRLNVRLKRRHGFHNPGGFDYEGWLLQNGIAATGYVRNSDMTHAWPAADAADVLLHLRTAVDRRLQTALDGVSQPGLLRALTLGVDDGIPAAQWAVFRATGTGHLVAISGMHISLVAGLGFAAMRWLWSRSARLTNVLAAPRAAAIAALLLATLYSVLAGFGIPTQRAWIMVSVLLSGVMLGRPTRPAHNLALALLAVILFDPFAVLSPGFWLSFVAVAIIFARLSPRRATDRGTPRTMSSPTFTTVLPTITQGLAARVAHVGSETRELVRLQWALSLGLLPLTLLFFGQLGWIAPFANLLAVPWTTLLLMPLVFAGLFVLYPLPALAHLLFALAGWAAERMDALLTALAGLPGSMLGMPELPAWVYGAAFVGVGLLLLLPRGTPYRGLGWLALVPLATWTPPRPEAGTAWFTLLDVGQGLAAVVQTREHTLVFDTGPRFSADFDTGTAVLVPFLAAQGIRHVDTLVVSHGDNDHRGGAVSLAARLPVYRLSTSVPQYFDWRYSNRCTAEQHWTWDGVRFRMLHPPAERTADENDSSCVLQIETGDGERLLLTGDIEAAAERALVSRYGDVLRSRLLVVPHHGSRTSSTAAFIHAVAPQEVLIPAGYRNRYGFPHPTVAARYRAFGARLWRTGTSGAVHVHLGETGPTAFPVAERRRDPRYWHSAVAVPPER
ncbi:MAG: DNA internalization-related competence protein ComEC/Rec2 [Gammaproteobacteria bacterium]|nr:DNA internalization-related competence protein ComEC/Rec2 [Gammaproteobacteria bacterium]